jgi:radical SAM superfamily enzyme YgiQ (UPF0313 family)
MNVCLIQPSFHGFAPRQPPLGLAYLASVLREQGAQVSIIDANAEGLSTSATATRILANRPDMLGVTMTTPLVGNGLEIMRLVSANKLNIHLLAGGPHATAVPEEILTSGPKNLIVVRGEGELTMAELYEYFQGDRSLTSIDGISYRRDGAIVHNPDRELLQDLDSLPLPSWDLLPLDIYRSEVRRNKYCLPIMTSRGCPFSCVFCFKGVFQGRYRPRNPQSIIEEWEYLVKGLGVEEIAVIDDNFTLHKNRVNEICEMIVAKGLAVPWTTPNGIRAHPISLPMLQNMQKAGCYRVYFGVESGDPAVLKSINKKAKPEHFRNAVSLASQAGLETGAFFMIGNLSETEETIDQTIKFAQELNPDYAQFTVATPYPGTEMYQRITEEGEMLVNTWEEFSSYDKAIFRHGALTPELVNRKYREAFRSYYFRPRFVLRHLTRLRSKKQLINLMWGIKEVLRQSVRPSRWWPFKARA